MDYQKYFSIADEASNLASDFIVKNFGPIKEMTHKTETHYGIKDDNTLDKIYSDFLNKMSPEVSLYTEEGGKKMSNLTWLVDPIEGTSNYRVGNPFFATQICLLENKKPVISIVNAPLFNQKFTALINKGSFLNNIRLKIEKTTLEKTLISVGKGTKINHLIWIGETIQKIMPDIRTLRMFGSTGLEMAYVAANKIDVHINYGSQMYDIAPSALLIREAGGSVLNSKGTDWTIDDDYVVAGHPDLVQKILKIVV